MARKLLVAVVAVSLLGAFSFGLGADCFDETNPECWTCFSVFGQSYCSLVTSDGTVGRCDCTQTMFPRTCYPSGQFCGMIIVVG